MRLCAETQDSLPGLALLYPSGAVDTQATLRKETTRDLPRRLFASYVNRKPLSAARLLIHSPQRPADLKKIPPSTKEVSAHPPRTSRQR